jgi:hypothetical protein
MIKTQVQIPDHLYREAKRVAAEYEMSFAEVVRRGLERVTAEYRPKPRMTDWKLPEPENLGWNLDLNDDDLKRLARGEDEEPRV